MVVLPVPHLAVDAHGFLLFWCRNTMLYLLDNSVEEHRTFHTACFDHGTIVHSAQTPHSAQGTLPSGSTCGKWDKARFFGSTMIAPFSACFVTKR